MSADTVRTVARGRARLEPPDLSERGGLKNGEPQRSDERLFMQLLAFGGCRDAQAVARHLAAASVSSVLYEDLNDPLGIAVLTLSADPNQFVDLVRPLLAQAPFDALVPKPDYTMFGRTYAIGYEPELRETLHRAAAPHRSQSGLALGHVVPLRRSGRFSQLTAEEQRTILAEHGAIGMTFGAADLAHDIRLACHGLDRDDNDFVIGLIGKELFPLSAVVQAMRKTQQTSLYLDRLGPFFVGRALWQSPGNAE